MANGRNFSLDVIDVIHKMVTVSTAKGNKKWICSAIYANPILSARNALWDQMENIRPTLSDPWFLIGDFNEILLPSEVHGGNFLVNRATKFSQVLSNYSQIDLETKAICSLSIGMQRVIGQCLKGSTEHCLTLSGGLSLLILLLRTSFGIILITARSSYVAKIILPLVHRGPSVSKLRGTLTMSSPKWSTGLGRMVITLFLLVGEGS